MALLAILGNMGRVYRRRVRLVNPNVPKISPEAPWGTRKRVGAAAVEFALVAPLFFAMIFGIVEAGRMLHVQQIMTNATREGARRAMIAGASVNDVKTAVVDSLAGSGIDTTVVTDDKIKMNHSQPVRCLQWRANNGVCGAAFQ
jgi:Flp pilus assembly protein TadG